MRSIKILVDNYTGPISYRPIYSFNLHCSTDYNTTNINHSDRESTSAAGRIGEEAEKGSKRRFSRSSCWNAIATLIGWQWFRSGSAAANIALPSSRQRQHAQTCASLCNRESRTHVTGLGIPLQWFSWFLTVALQVSLLICTFLLALFGPDTTRHAFYNAYTV